MKSMLDDFADKASRRNVIVFGGGNQGRGIVSALQENGISVHRVLDRNPHLAGGNIRGVNVSDPEYLRYESSPQDNFVVVASFFFEKEMSAALDGMGFVGGSDYIPYTDLKKFDYVVEVSGVCNLRCISCPRSLGDIPKPPTKMMSLESFEMVIDKIRREDPFVRNIQLYQWGEPTLNKALPAMISYARENGVLCGISSNLNTHADYRAIIAAKPECLRISASGVGQDYSIAHTGGNWEIFSENLAAVSALRSELHPAMKVEFYYHRYRHSIGKPEQMAKGLCHELGFDFHPVPAYLISLDDVLAYAETGVLPDNASIARELMLVDLDTGLEAAMAEANQKCETFRTLMLNSDLTISPCMMYFQPQPKSTLSFLDIPSDQILNLRDTAELCGRCMKKGIHRYCGAYAKMSENDRYETR